MTLDTLADIPTEEARLITFAIFFGAAGFSACTAFVLPGKLIFESFSLRVIIVIVKFEVLSIVSIMTVYTVTIFSAFHTCCETLTVEFHALGVSTIAKFLPFVFL